MLEILISSSALILVLAILRFVLRDKISARLQYALWLLVLIRLLVPVSFFHSPVSVAGAAAPVTERAERVGDTILVMRGAPTLDANPLSSARMEQDTVLENGTAVLLRDVVRYVWYTGMGIMALWFGLVNLRLARRLKKNRTLYGYHSVVPIYTAEGILSPCLFGLFRPTIYLTERAAEDDTRAWQIIAHELTHFRHGDMLWTFLRSVCLTAWWFNPLVWLAAALSRQDCELACDEGTIKALGEDARFDYGRTLVGMANVGARPSDILCGATTMTTGKRSLKVRVARISQAPKMSVTVAVIVLVIAGVAVGCTYVGTMEETEQAEAQIILNELGSYGIPDMELFHQETYEMALGSGNIKELLPNWKGKQSVLWQGKNVYRVLGTNSVNVILTYARYWSDEAHKEIDNAAAFAYDKAVISSAENVTMTDNVQVNYCNSYIYTNSTEGSTIVWYDTNAELIFSLNYSAHAVNAEQPSKDLLIALAESVELG